MHCTVSLDDLRRGTSIPLAHLGGAEVYLFGPSVAPDGRTATAFVDNDPRLLDLETGSSLAELEDGTQPAWTPDGSWLFTRSDDNSLLAISTRGEASRVIPMPEGYSIWSADLVLAVG
jgi:hypothetical protein